MKHFFDEYTSFKLDGVTFFPSERGYGYDLYATSADQSQLLYVNLASGKNSIIDGKTRETQLLFAISDQLFLSDLFLQDSCNLFT